MNYQAIYDIAEVCFRKNVTDIVLCPGSRCAPLTLAFTRHKSMLTRTFPDERSAGFIALGIAQQKRQPVIMVCTSGSAAYNFAPAVAEAFFSETPLIVFTADRPSEWIAQQDGQTIYQSEIFGQHVKKSFTLPQEYSHPDSQWAINRVINDAINLSLQEPRGPVHINAPFREPLYPEKGELTFYSEQVRVIEQLALKTSLTNDVRDFIEREFAKFRKVLIVAGQQEANPDLVRLLVSVSKNHQVAVVSDVISNVNGQDEFIYHSDLFLGQANDEIKKTLQPELLVTFGKSLVSKNLKLFLRKFPAVAHWHLQAAGVATDTFKSLTTVIPVTPVDFLDSMERLPAGESFESQKKSNYQKLWSIEERRVRRVMQDYFPLNDLNELEVVKELLSNLPAGANLHLANSMSVRYANFVGLEARSDVKVFANRGTSGIDGCSSTAVGHCLADDSMNVLITGDIAFFYDRNAFWHNYPLPNLRILLLNNHGGLIFNMIDGPASQPEAAEYFITLQRLTAVKLCEEFGFQHIRLDHRRKLKNYLLDFLEMDGSTKIMEVETDLHLNRTVFDNLKKKIKNSYDA